MTGKRTSLFQGPKASESSDDRKRLSRTAKNEIILNLQQSLTDTQERYRLLFESMSNGVAIYMPVKNGSDFLLIDMNRAAQKIDRLDKSKIVGRSIMEIYPNIKDYGLLDIFQKVLKTGRPVNHPVKKYTDQRLDGWRDHFVYKLTTGEIVTVFSDETKRKKAEERHRQVQGKFRALVENAPDCIFIKDRSLRFTYVNPAMENLVGLPLGQIKGLRAIDLYGKESARQLHEWDRRVLSGETIEEEHSRVVKGIPMTFHDIRAPIRNDSGKIVGLCGISRDVTGRRTLGSVDGLDPSEYSSETMKETLNKASIATKSNSAVLLLGESGSGKDFMARWIHDHSARSDGPFFAINCAAIPHDLAESELFGHEQGAFTGSRARKRGLLELAEGGTLLLNEIGELSLQVQSKLLTFLDTRTFMRVGGERTIHIDARIMAATHRNLMDELENGNFLKALYYRISVIPIEVPPLRLRSDDIPNIAKSLMAKLVKEMNLDWSPRISDLDTIKLQEYNWPGNIRELRNVLERSIMLSRGKGFKVALDNDCKPAEGISVLFDPKKIKSLKELSGELICSIVKQTVSDCSGNKKEAARLLKVSRDTIHRYLRLANSKHSSDTTRYEDAEI